MKRVILISIGVYLIRKYVTRTSNNTHFKYPKKEVENNVFEIKQALNTRKKLI